MMVAGSSTSISDADIPVDETTAAKHAQGRLQPPSDPNQAQPIRTSSRVQCTAFSVFATLGRHDFD